MINKNVVNNKMIKGTTDVYWFMDLSLRDAWDFLEILRWEGSKPICNCGSKNVTISYVAKTGRNVYLCSCDTIFDVLDKTYFHENSNPATKKQGLKSHPQAMLALISWSVNNRDLTKYQMAKICSCSINSVELVQEGVRMHPELWGLFPVWYTYTKTPIKKIQKNMDKLFLNNQVLRKSRQSEVFQEYLKVFGFITESEFSLTYGNTMSKPKRIK